MAMIKIENRVEPCVDEPKLGFEDDKLYLYTPLRHYGEGIYDVRLVMTKDIFQECYRRWIEPQESEVGENDNSKD